MSALTTIILYGIPTSIGASVAYYNTKDLKKQHRVAAMCLCALAGYGLTSACRDTYNSVG